MFVGVGWRRSKGSVFCNPTHKTETGTTNRWGTSKPPGPIIMIGQSETLSTSHIICITHTHFYTLEYTWSLYTSITQKKPSVLRALSKLKIFHPKKSKFWNNVYMLVFQDIINQNLAQSVHADFQDKGSLKFRQSYDYVLKLTSILMWNQQFRTWVKTNIHVILHSFYNSFYNPRTINERWWLHEWWKTV